MSRINATFVLAHILIVTDKTAVSYHWSIPNVESIQTISVALLYYDLGDDKILYTNYGYSKVKFAVIWQFWGIAGIHGSSTVCKLQIHKLQIIHLPKVEPEKFVQNTMESEWLHFVEVFTWVSLPIKVRFLTNMIFNVSCVVELMQSWEELYHCVGSKVWGSILHIVVQRMAGKGWRAVRAIGGCHIVVVSSPALMSSS